MILLVFVASLRDGNFTLYLQTLEELAPWFFALDQQNYGRWLSVHIHDMKKLQGGSSMCYEDLMQGRFVLQKTSRPFSKMALDQAHEQNNAIIKGEGGAVGLTENPSAWRRWMIGGPEVSKVLQDLELSFEIKRSKESDQHHEQDKGFQENFKAAVCRLMDVIQETGNPFLEKKRRVSHSS
ncbi:hypothetical protein Bpfe_009287 [Biomphalaria pfeifferi]|uniref:Uncharacterized protein n=1 Tax=Biomphalaria pfeifferi TaxID=112525 RepID=A0AAD8BUX2_BIOPF|nr:hypothetical protein Bpfe_009287 [Biomphalaria pfeifferi]